MHRFSILLAALTLGLVLAAGLAQAAPVVQLETTMGNIEIRLDDRKAPVTVANFLQYVQSGFYDGTIFHRVIAGFMIQGGGLTPDFRQKSGRAPIRNEASNGRRNARYTVAMARTSDPDSATSQFFINTKNNRFLDPDRAQDGVGYAVFGVVIRGREVVDRIEKVQTTDSHPQYKDAPVEPVIIRKATVLEDRK